MKIPNIPLKNNVLDNLIAVVAPLQKKIIMRIVLLALTIVLTLVLIFAQTIAWQTNVVQTGGIMFSADTWNFSSEILINSQIHSIAPGKSGVIEMQMTNKSTSLAAASVMVSKAQLNAQVKNRLYFYIETSVVRHGETVDRVYVNQRNSYTYTIFPYSELLLNAETLHQPLLKWEWTYDNLGYYVYGEQAEDGSIQISEYLSPIEYDYDAMRTTFDETGRLETTDGSTTAEQFLLEWSKKDGYEGQIDTANPTQEGYYPVKVNAETGYGVWAYLCTRQQIEEANAADTALGNNSSDLGHATVQITGQNCHNDGVMVYDQSSLIAALEQPGLNMITLNQDIALTEPIDVTDSSQVIIDLGKHTLTSTADKIISAKNGAAVMLCNGSISGSEKTTAVYSEGASVTLNDVEVTNVKEGIVISDHLNSSGLDSTIPLVGSSITASEDGLLVYGNGADSERNTVIVIENCEIEGQYYAGITCNGAEYGTDIEITDSTVKGYYAAIYFPQRDSTLTVTKSVLEGVTGLAVKGGTVYVVDSTVKGTGEHLPLPEDASGLSKSGWWDTGDGSYLEANYTEWETKIYISGQTTRVTSADVAGGALAVRKFPEDAAQASIKISGGTYNSDVSAYLDSGYAVSQTTDQSGTYYTVNKQDSSGN